MTAAINHTSETQKQGWLDLTSNFYAIYNASPRGQESPADQRTFAIKTVGMLTDHAEDQKKLVRLIQEWKTTSDREVRGEKALPTLPLAELLLIVAEETAAVMDRANGAQAETPEEMAERDLEIARGVIRRVGEDSYAALPQAEREVAELFVHAGCCMHKELNAAKGGYSRLQRFWKSRGLTGPCLLMNKDNDAAAQAGGAAAVQAAQKSTGGAVKTAELAGTWLRHKDDKKGQQDAFRYFIERMTGKIFTFPDTSNTRFGSHGDAASVLVTYLPLLRDYLEQTRDGKTTGRWNHLEQNLHKALGDEPTLTEMCIISLYSEAIAHPYMGEVRRPDHPNHLSLGPLHDRVKAHIRALIADPDLLLDPNASHVSGALDGKAWEHPEAFIAVHKLIPHLPHVRDGLVEFLIGALETWERFSAEFRPDGAIAQLSENQQSKVFMAATNDANEGALGSFRVEMRQATNMSLGQWNARAMYKKNSTTTYMSSLDPETLKYLRAKYRVVDASGIEKERRDVLAKAAAEAAETRKAHRQVTAAKKTTRLTALRNLVPILDNTALTSALRVADIQQQLRWHRQWVDVATRAEKKMRPAKDLGGKEDQLRELREAVCRYNSHPELQQLAASELEAFDRSVGRAGDEEVESSWEEIEEEEDS